MNPLTGLQALVLIPVIAGSAYLIASVWTAWRFRRWARRSAGLAAGFCPAVTVLKPVCGLEKNLLENLRSTVRQDYPDFQVVLSVQRRDDPAIPMLEAVQREFGPERVTVAVECCDAGPNGKINNLVGGLKHARHDILVISDSDVRLRPDYLKTIVAPLSDPAVGCVCTLYKAVEADRWFERLELLTINAELTPNIIFVLMTGVAKFCLGASTAIRRKDLEQLGGLESLADYLVEDYEMGRRLWTAGRTVAIVPYVVDTVVDLKSPSQWWYHLIYWDQNNRAAAPRNFFGTILIRPVPFAVLFALATLGSPAGWFVLAGAVTLRLLCASIVLGSVLRDREGLRSLWLVPLRDCAALVSFLLAYTKRTTVWRDVRFTLTRDGRLVAESSACDA